MLPYAMAFTALRNQRLFHISRFRTTHEQPGFELEAQLKERSSSNTYYYTKKCTYT